MTKIKTKSKSKIKNQKEIRLVKVIAEKNIRPVLSDWIAEVLESSPTRKNYEDTLSFVEDIIKNAPKEPNYLRLVIRVNWLMQESELAAKLLNHIFETVTHSHGISENKMESILEFDHKLIIEELKDVAKELQHLKTKAKK
ncbi:hypothetical protein M0P48_05220 [Candidatus Gracilibacteria bacterium]|jgi:hypothetical protein|nr:hypothetical protein [Candidatus Gracilibacteria bacterium]